MKCPKCKADNPDTKPFCADCGTQLTSSGEAQPPITKTIETPREELTTGSIFAERYEIIKELGRGGMGRVYLAHDQKLDRDVALKFLGESIQKDNKARERLIREAKSAAALDHPFICKIHDADETEEKVFIVMEYIQGESLSEKMRHRPLSTYEIFRIMAEVAEALEKAHEEGIIHRDLKPSNIMITPQGHAKVMDFGIAKRVYSEDEAFTRTITKDSLTREGSIIGTLAYMSPEQARGNCVDNRSDIFSLGIILYELLSGKQPFTRANTAETLSAILRDQPSPVSIKPKRINPVVDRILHKALAKDPHKRYQNVSEFCAEIRNAQNEIVAKGITFLRGWQKVIVAAASIALILIGALWLIWFKNIGKVEEPPEPILLLVADFQNKTNDQVFEGALEQALCIGLEGSPFVSIFRRGDAKKVAHNISSDGNGKLDAEMAQLVARREGIELVVTGIIEAEKDKYYIQICALDPTSSKKVIESSESFKRKEEVFGAIDNLSENLRSGLGENIKDSSQRRLVETFTTKSLGAMKDYARAQKLLALGKFKEAIEAYKGAIEKDSDFGRAYSGLAASSYNIGKRKEAFEYIEQAVACIDKMNDREKYRTRGVHFLMKRNWEKAIDEFSMLVEQFPADFAGYANLAMAYWGIGDYESAVEHIKISRDLNPRRAVTYKNLSEYAFLAGELELAEESAMEALRINPIYESSSLYVYLVKAQICLGKPDKAEETLQLMRIALPESKSVKRTTETNSLNIALYESRLNDAEKILQAKIDPFNNEKQTRVLAQTKIQLAEVYMLQGKNSLAVKSIDDVKPYILKNDVWNSMLNAADIYLKLKLLNEAASLLKEIDKPRRYRKEFDEASAKALARTIEGEILLNRGKRLLAKRELEKAIDLFNKAKSLDDTWINRFYLGYAFLINQDFTEAHSEFELCLRRIKDVTSPTLYKFIPLVHYYQGQVQEGLKSQAAIDSYQIFLEMKRRGDDDILVMDARTRLAHLKGR